MSKLDMVLDTLKDFRSIEQMLLRWAIYKHRDIVKCKTIRDSEEAQQTSQRLKRTPSNASSISSYGTIEGLTSKFPKFELGSSVSRSTLVIASTSKHNYKLNPKFKDVPLAILCFSFDLEDPKNSAKVEVRSRETTTKDFDIILEAFVHKEPSKGVLDRYYKDNVDLNMIKIYLEEY